MKKILWAACLMAALSLAGCSDDENGNGGNGGNGGSGEGGNPSGGDLTEILFEDGTQIGDGRQEFEIKGDYTLPKGTYLLKGWCYIADGASLTLAPGTIIGGVSFMLYGMISAIGVRNVVENKVDLTKSRNLIIAAVILVSGLGFSSGLTFTIGGASITLTGLAIAAIAGIVLNAILPGNDYEFGMNEKGDENRGIHA